MQHQTSCRYHLKAGLNCGTSHRIDKRVEAYSIPSMLVGLLFGLRLRIRFAFIFISY